MEVKPGGLGAVGGATPGRGPLPLSLGCLDKVLSEAAFEPLGKVHGGA